MREKLIDQDILIGENLRLIKRLWKVEKSCKFPQGLEFAIQLLHFKNTCWIQIARADNQLHEGKSGSHLHIGNKVKWENLVFQDAEELMLEIGKRLK